MRTLNVRLTAVLLVVGIVFGSGVVFLHGYQVRRNAYVFKREADRAQERADAALKENDVKLQKKAMVDVVKNLRWYVRLAPNDVDSMEKLSMLLADRAQDALEVKGGVVSRVVDARIGIASDGVVRI